MSFTAIIDGTADINGGGQPLTEWEVFLPATLDVPPGKWNNVGQLQLHLRVRFVATKLGGTPVSGTTRFLNPSQLQIGHYAMESSGFVVTDGRLKYNAQQANITTETIYLSGTNNDAPKRFNNTSRTTVSHAQNTDAVSLCGTARGITTAPAAPYAEDLDARIGTGGICLAVLPGRLELAEIPGLAAAPRLVLSADNIGMPTRISGVIWADWRLQIFWEIGWLEAATTALYIPSQPLITSAPTFAPVSYTCQFGQAIPNRLSPCTYVAGYVPNQVGGGGYLGSCDTLPV